MSAWSEGEVQWFDKTSGEGMIVSDEGESLYVHYSTIMPEGPKGRSLTISRRNLEAGQRVKFQVYQNSYSRRIEKVKEIRSV